MNINHVTIVGRLTRDPEMKALPSGSKVTNFSVATSRTYVNENGGKVETPEFHSIVAFGKTAELAAQYLKKGQLCGIEGRLQTRSWEKDGSKQYRTEIIADRVQFGPKSAPGAEKEPEAVVDAESGDVRTPAKGTAPAKPIDRTNAKVGSTEIEYPQEEINPDDIPF